MPRAIVSLTTHGARVPFVATAVESLVRQAEANDCKLCLAVSEEDSARLPQMVVALVNAGRVELIVEKSDFGVNMKWIPARRVYPDAKLICLDDDRIYSDMAIPQLLSVSEALPDALLCYAYRSLFVFPDGSTAPYNLSRASGCKAVLHTGREIFAPAMLRPGMFIAEHWAMCLHPPRFGLDSFDEAVRFAPRDDDTFLSVLASRIGVPCYCVPMVEPVVTRDLMRDATFAGCDAIRSSALGEQSNSGWSRTAGVLRHYEPELRAARAKDVGWNRFGLRLLITCAAYPKRRIAALAECKRVGLSVRELRCPHLATDGLTEETCPDAEVRRALEKVPVGTAATLLVHWTAMRKLLESPCDSMLVVEDDARFLRDTEKLGLYVKSLPSDFGEARFCWGGARVDACRGEAFAGGRWRKAKRNLDSLYMTAAYAVSRKGAEAWLRAFHASFGDPMPSDLLVRKYGSSENVYICNPPCAITASVGEPGAVQNDNTPLILDVEACGGRAEDYQNCVSGLPGGVRE